MPAASPPVPAREPASLDEGERTFIEETVQRFYGPGAIVRSYGPDPSRLDLHIETDAQPDMRRYDVLGVLITRIDRPVSLDVTTRATRTQGSAKLAYRQGVIL